MNIKTKNFVLTFLVENVKVLAVIAVQKRKFFE